jgi:16S rRNA (guanine527-N7)-methyltransferase
MTSRQFQDRLERRAKRAGVTVPAGVGAKLEVYYRLLATWNQKINLTGMDLAEPTPEVLDRLLVEPLVAATHLPHPLERMIDIGTGGGSPAVPLALIVPRVRLLMVESKTRKSVFLREAIRALELVSADVTITRFEALLSRPDLHEAHDLLTIRAVRLEARTLMTLQAFVKPGGQLFLFRGAGPTDPSDMLLSPLVWLATYPLVASLRSRLVILEKRDAGVGTVTYQEHQTTR